MKKLLVIITLLMFLLSSPVIAQMIRVQIVADKTVICAGDSVQLRAIVTFASELTSLSYQWSPKSLFTNPESHTSFAIPVQTTRFLLKVTDNTYNIVKEDSLVIIVNPCNPNVNNIQVSFIPVISSQKIDSIRITNLYTNQGITLMENEILTLTGITENKVLTNSTVSGNLYPNPSTGEAFLEFSTEREQMVEMRLFSISGQLITVAGKNLKPGLHRFKISFPGRGIYPVSVIKEDGRLHFKAVSSGSNSNHGRFDYENSGDYAPLKHAPAEKTLNYSVGDNLHYSVFSNGNNTLIIDSPVSTKKYNVEFHPCVDPDQKSYKIVKIGNQWWMAENLAYLPSVSPSSQGSATASFYYVYGYQGGDIIAAKASNNYPKYGVLYNWTAAMAGAASSNTNPSKVQGACPAGWHLPGDTEWTAMENYLIANGYNFDGTTTGNKIAKSLAATMAWFPGGAEGEIGTKLYKNNKSGFSALPGGYRGFFSDMFGSAGDYGAWWSSTSHDATHSKARALYFYSANLPGVNYDKAYGYSVRCVKDL